MSKAISEAAVDDVREAVTLANALHEKLLGSIFQAPGVAALAVMILERDAELMRRMEARQQAPRAPGQ